MIYEYLVFRLLKNVIKNKKKKNYIVEYDDNILYLLFDTIFGYNRKLYIYIIYFYSGERKM